MTFDYTTAQAIPLADAAKVLAIPRSTAYDLARDGRFPVRVLKIGRSWRVPVADLEAFIKGAA